MRLFSLFINYMLLFMKHNKILSFLIFILFLVSFTTLTASTTLQENFILKYKKYYPPVYLKVYTKELELPEGFEVREEYYRINGQLTALLEGKEVLLKRLILRSVDKDTLSYITNLEVNSSNILVVSKNVYDRLGGGNKDELELAIGDKVLKFHVVPLDTGIDNEYRVFLINDAVKDLLESFYRVKVIYRKGTYYDYDEEEIKRVLEEQDLRFSYWKNDIPFHIKSIVESFENIGNFVISLNLVYGLIIVVIFWKSSSESIKKLFNFIYLNGHSPLKISFIFNVSLLTLISIIALLSGALAFLINRLFFGALFEDIKIYMLRINVSVLCASSLLFICFLILSYLWIKKIVRSDPFSGVDDV